MSANVYYILGAVHSGRRQVVCDLVHNGIPAQETVLVLIAKGDDPCAQDEQLEAPENVNVFKYLSIEEALEAIMAYQAKHIFFLSDGRQSPVDQMERLKQSLSAYPLAVCRILTVVDCRLLVREEAVMPWYEACIHFSDVVILSYAQDLNDALFKAFLVHYKQERCPCLFVTPKDGAIPNPAEVLYPEARRMSLIFDDIDPAEFFDENDLLEGPVTLKAYEDPYFVRTPKGDRCKVIPDIRDFLKKSSS